MNEMCDIFIMCFVLFLFVTCFGWNFNVIVVVEEEEEGGREGGRGWRREGGRRWKREEGRRRREVGGGGGLFGCNYD
jgi:hypothetical protein